MTDAVERTPMTVGDAVVAAAARLAHPVRGGALTTREAMTEAIDLVAALHDVPRFWPRLERASAMGEAMVARVLAAAEQRARGAPLAYAVGRAAFRHLTLSVDERVLIPRPETEQLVECVLAHVRGGGREGGTAIDVGTGSGAIALALASEGTFSGILATDISHDALAVASANGARLAARGALHTPVTFLAGSLLAPVRARGTTARVVVANPPYIAYDEAAALPPDVRDWEPAVALFSGGHGLDITRRLVHEATTVLEPGGLLALEIDARRASLVAELVAAHVCFADVAVRLDLAGRERFVLATMC